MATMISKEPTAAELAACTKHEEENGHWWYEVESKTEPGAFYQVLPYRNFSVLGCNCASGRDGGPCWHKRAVEFLERHQALRRDERGRILR